MSAEMVLMERVVRLEAALAAATEDARSAREEAERLRGTIDKVNGIRNSIIGMQTVNWSEHVYPLVAALDSAGIEGMGYGEARPYFGTMLERTVKAEDDRDAHREALRALVDACDPFEAAVPDTMADWYLMGQPTTAQHHRTLNAALVAALALLGAPNPATKKEIP